MTKGKFLRQSHYLQFALIVLQLFFTWSTHAATLNEQMLEVYQSFGAGRYETAMKVAEKTLPEYERIGGDDEIFALQLFTDLCLRAYDANCAASYLLKSTNLINKKIASTTGQEKQKYFTHLISDIEKSVRLSYITGDYETVKKLVIPLEKMLDNLVVLENPFAYVEGRISLAYWYIKEGNKSLASEEVEKAWLNFLSIKKIYDPDLIKYSTQFISLFNQLGQTKRAVYVSKILRPLVEKSGGVNQYDAFRFALLNRNAAIYENNSQIAVGSMLYAAEMLKTLEFPEVQKSFFDLTIKATVLIDCFNFNNEICGAKSNLYTELKQKLLDEANSGKLAPLQRRTIALALALDDLSRSEKSEQFLLTALETPVEKTVWDDGSTVSHEALLKLSQFLIEFSKGRMDLAASNIIEASKIEVAKIKNNEAINPLDVQMLNSHQRTLFLIANSFITRQEVLSNNNKAYLFDSMNLINTTLRNVESKYLKLLSSEKSKLNQGSLQSYHRLKQDSELLERRILSDRVSVRMASTQWDNAVGLMDVNQLIRLNKIRQDLGRFNKTKWVLENPESDSGLKDFQSVLKASEVFITYQVVESNLLLLCVSKTELFTGLGQINSNTGIDIKLLQAALSNPSPPSKEVDGSFPVNAAQRLSKILLEPIKSCFRGKSHIFFTQDESVAGLSHHVLIDPNADSWQQATNSNLRAVPWLGHRYSISLLTGADHLVSTRRIKTDMVSSFDFLGVGNPLLSGNTVDGQQRGRSVLRGVVNSSSISELDELPDTETELKNVARSFGKKSKLLLGANATEVAVRRLPLRDFDVIEFATHGLVRDEISGLAEPALVLTPNNSKLEIDDGLLTATDISRMDLNASLVILSACNSARFNFNFFGSENASLSTAFFLAGAKSTLASLWSVNSEATNQLMSRFAKEYARNNNDAARALQISMASMQNISDRDGKFIHPRYWASFVLYGDSSVKAHGISKPIHGLYLQPSIDLMDQKGHIQNATYLNNTFVVAGAKPDGRAGDYAGFIKGMDSDNKVKWEISDPAYFFGIVINSSTSKSFIALASPVNYKRAGAYKIMVINYSGKVEKVIKLTREANEVAHRAQLLQDGSSIAFASSVLSSDEYLSSFEFRILNIKTGSLIKKKLTSSANLSHPSLKISQVDANTMALVFSGSSYLNKVNPTITDTGMFQSCIGSKQTEIAFMNVKFEEVMPRKFYQNISLSKITRLKSGKFVVAFTEHDRCTQRNIKAGIAKFDLDSGALSPIFFDLLSYEVNPSEVIEVGSNVIASGFVNRIFDNSAVETNIGANDLKVTDGFMSADPNMQTGILVVQMDEKSFTIKNMDVLFNGLDIYANDIVPVDAKKMRFFGNSSDRQFSATLSIP